MPVPLNAVVEMTRSWLSKRLGYHVDMCIPVRPSAESVKATTPMDIDLICTHPKLDRVSFSIGNMDYVLPRNLLIECKGWFDYASASRDVLRGLSHDMQLMGDSKFIPKSASKKKHGLFFTLLKEEFYEKGTEVFGGDRFARVIVCPHLQTGLKLRNGQVIEKKSVLEKARDKGIFVVELRHMAEDLVDYCRRQEAKDFLRRDFVLEILHLLDVAKQLKSVSL